MTTKHNGGFFLHPHEVSFCGYSNSGKTTLIERLVREMCPKYSIAFYKHDAHKFQMDKPGKDTEKIYSAGADQVFITDKTHFAEIHRGAEHFVDIRAKVHSADILFIEGFKEASAKKMILLDSDMTILEKVSNGDVTNILGYVGPFEQPPKEIQGATYFHRDDVRGIQDFLLKYFSQLQSDSINGLVLVGGKSSRMQQDKASLIYNSGLSQVDYAANQLREVCDSVYASSRPDQQVASADSELKFIFDKFVDMGPMGGILSALMEKPNEPWLVLACDLPFLDGDTLSQLVQSRNPFKIATCFTSSSDGMPEPLCAIYEPKSYQRFLQFFANGYRCPRKMLINSRVENLVLTNSNALDNVNHPHERDRAISQLESQV